MTYSQFGCCGNSRFNLLRSFSSSLRDIAQASLALFPLRSSVQHYWSKFHTAFTLHQISLVLLTVSSDLYLRNGAPPLRVAAQEVLHHHITALPVGTHRAMLETSYFFFAK